MSDAFFTQTGERPDLAALEVNPPEGYIGSEILPLFPVSEKSGSMSYATVTADAAAQTGRSAGVAPTTTQISNSTTTYTAAEAVKRGGVTPDEAKQMGGIAKADEVGSKWAKRQVLNKIETDIATAVLGGAPDAIFAVGTFLTDVQQGLDAIRHYAGKTVLIGATQTLKAVVQALIADDNLGPVFSRLVQGTDPKVAISGMSFESFMAGLAMFLGVDRVLAGTDEIWAAGSLGGRFAIAKIDVSGDPLSHKWQPVLGKVIQFLPDGEQPFVCTSVADRVAINNLYDAQSWYQVKTLNANAVFIFEHAPEGDLGDNPSSSSESSTS